MPRPPMSFFRANASGQGCHLVPLAATPPWREEDRKRWANYEQNARPAVPVPPPDTPDAPHPSSAGPEAGKSPTTPDASAAPVETEGSPAASVSPEKTIDEILADLTEFIGDYLICSDDQRIILVLWVMHTWCFNEFWVTPYLNICSPEKQSGKTACLQLLRVLSGKSWMPGGGLTPARLMTRVARLQPTLLLDDWHTVFRPSDSQAIMGFLTAGCMRGSSFAPRSAAEDRDQDIFCPKAFAGARSLPPALADRSIPILLQRSRPSESPMPCWHDLISFEAAPLVKPLRGWIESNRPRIADAACRVVSTRLHGLTRRQWETASPLLAIALAIGGRWPQKLRAALLRTFTLHAEDDLTAGVQLLADVRGFFARNHDPAAVSTKQLLRHLNEEIGLPWDRFHKGKPLTPNGLRKLLRGFGICRSSSQQIGGERLKGFRFRDFVESWERYLPAAAGIHPAKDAKREVVRAASEVVKKGHEVVRNTAEVVRKT